MPCFWAAFSILSCLLALSSGKKCTFRETTTGYDSPELQSLRCYNDYEQYVYCYWNQSLSSPKLLELWNWHKRRKDIKCEPLEEPVQDHKSFLCRYESKGFGIGSSHTFFFKTKGTDCLPDPDESLELSKHLRVHPPVNLSVQAVERGSTLLRWFSPYPSSSSLNQNLTYQLSYRGEGQENWIVEESQHTQLHLKAGSLSAGCQYEARVRARGMVGQWSEWSPLVAWQTEAEPGQGPRLQCVLTGEKEVCCSWEVKRDQAHFITYQLACQGPPKPPCCGNLTITSVGHTVLRFSCTLTVPDPYHLWLKLLPTHNTQAFMSHEHIQPNRPQHLEVEQRDDNWLVKWGKATHSTLSFTYQVQYWNTKKPEERHDINGSSLFYIIKSASLAPSQQYQVRVRSLVVPGEKPSYRGIPSDWTDPVQWDSNPASWSPQSLFYIGIAVVVTIVFIILLGSVAECRRKLVKLYASAPSPRKSKVLSDIKEGFSQKSGYSSSSVSDEDAYICKVLQLEKVPISPSEALVCDSKETDNKQVFRFLSDDAGCWDCDDPCSPVENRVSTETSGLSFTGPYIFCESLEPKKESVDLHEDTKEEDSFSDGSLSLSSDPFLPPTSSPGPDYVTLPNASLSSSALEVPSHHNNMETTDRRDSDNLDDQDSSSPLMSCDTEIQSDLNPSVAGGDPLAYVTAPFTSCPPQVVQQPSVYVLLP